LNAEEFGRAMRAETSEADGDVSLTELGLRQAQQLCDAWAPLLEPKARDGRLHLFVSPMKRTLMTADPLCRRLNATCGQRAMVKPSIMEFAGLTAPSDMQVFDKTDQLRKAGDFKGIKELMKSYKWKHCGFPGNRLLETFPWAQLPADFPLETPWWTQGFESPKKADERLGGLMAEVREYPRTFAEGDVIVFITHGGTIGDIVFRLLMGCDPSSDKSAARRQPNFETSDNTAVTSLILPGEKFVFEPPLRGPTHPTEFGCRLEFFNNVLHLGESRMHRWAQQSGIIPAKAKL